jgi:hypothetical protein
MCHREYSVSDWENLMYIGVTQATNHGFAADLEHRMCGSCGNDLTQTCVTINDVIRVKA